MKLEFSIQIIEKNLKYQISSKSDQWEPSCSMRMDITKLTVAFRSFANEPENSRRKKYVCSSHYIVIAIKSKRMS